MSVYDSPQLQQAQTTAQTAQGQANQAAQAGFTLPDMLRDTLMKKFSQDNPLIQQRSGALTNYLNETTRAPLDYTAKSAGGNSDVVYNPLQQANLIQGRRSAALAPLTSANTLLSMSGTGIDDIINSASRAQQGYATGLQQNATSARQNYTDILDVLSKKADEAYKNRSLDIAATKATKPTASQQYKQQELMNAIAGALGNIKSARDALTKTPSGIEYSGGSIRAKLPGWLGGYGDDVNALNSALANYNTSLFEVAGKAFTGPEKKIIEGLVADITKNPSANAATLNQAEQRLLNQLDILQNQGGFNTNSSGSSSDPLGLF